VKVGRDRIEKNPDQRVREALQLVFAKFAEFQSARQVHIWLRDEAIALPVKSRDGEARGIVWRLPAYNIVHNILTNPIYAGAYAFGRTTSKVSVEQGRKRVRRGVHRPMAEWDVLIKDHHASYIAWEEFERNQSLIANNATGKGSAAARGQFGAESCCCPAFCAVVIAAASCTCPTVASLAATTAMAPAQTTARHAASRSAA
jgi:hypothetical protein